MAEVTLSTLWVNDASDLSSAYALPLSDFHWKAAKTGNVRTYGNGRRRLVRRVGVNRSAVYALGLCDRATVNLLEDWTGRLLCFRDPVGRKFYGVFWDVDFSEVDGADGASLSIEVEEVTHTEEV